MKSYIRNQRGRMFENPFLEFFSKVHPTVPFVFWSPIVIGSAVYGLATGLTHELDFAIWFSLGVLSWQILEYLVHKRLFHWQGIGPISRRFHDIAHGFHHKYPDDEERLVMPLPVSIGIGAPIAILASLLHRPVATLPWWCGLVAGYLFYDFVHWSTHFRKPLTRWGKKLRAHHMAHHFADTEANFGISHRWIDALMGTLQKRTPRELRDDDNRKLLSRAETVSRAKATRPTAELGAESADERRSARNARRWQGERRPPALVARARAQRSLSFCGRMAEEGAPP